VCFRCRFYIFGRHYSECHWLRRSAEIPHVITALIKSVNQNDWLLKRLVYENCDCCILRSRSTRWSTFVWCASVFARMEFSVSVFIVCSSMTSSESTVTRSKVNELWPRNVTSSRTRPTISGWSKPTGYANVDLTYLSIVLCDLKQKKHRCSMS